MVRILHTADWQMGLKAAHMGVKAREVREKRFETVARIVKLAQDERVDFVVVAGDTFEAVDIDEGVVKRTVDLLNTLAPIPVFILPGNHDLLGPGSVWTRPGWRGAGANVHLLAESKEVPLPGDVTLYPCPLTQKRTAVDPTAWVPPRSEGDSRIRIGVAHGGLDIFPKTVNFPIPFNRVETSGLDYLALGDWHGLRLHGRSCYPGTPEPTAFDEAEPGKIIIVEISAAGQTPRVEPRSVALLHWVAEEPEIADPTDVRAFEEKTQALGSASSLVLHIRPRISPSAPQEAIEALATLRKAWEATCFYLDWPEETLVPPSGSERALPEGLLAEADAALAAQEGSGRVDPAVLVEARSLLRKYAQEVQQ